MRDAEGQLGEADAEGAVDSQGRALQNLRRGAQQLAEQLPEQQGARATGPAAIRSVPRRRPPIAPTRSGGRCARVNMATISR